jgi:putative transposase
LLDQWAYLNGVELDFSRPGTPTDNAFIEAFNARIRAECLNASWFFSLADAREHIETRRIDCNTERPHSALGSLDAQGLRSASSTRPNNLMTTGPEPGAKPVPQRTIGELAARRPISRALSVPKVCPG